MEHSYTGLFEPAEEGGCVAFCPALPGLVTEGDTYEEARERVKPWLALGLTIARRRKICEDNDRQK
jgi:predicted RNase H-like HicB family nuclease